MGVQEENANMVDGRCQFKLKTKLETSLISENKSLQ
jgi:hypothetical protein